MKYDILQCVELVWKVIYNDVSQKFVDEFMSHCSEYEKNFIRVVEHGRMPI